MSKLRAVRLVQCWHQVRDPVDVPAASLVLNHVVQSLLVSSQAPSTDCGVVRVALQLEKRPDFQEKPR